LRRAVSAVRVYPVPMSLRIKQLREARGWTQEVLAARSNMSRSQLAMIERETRPANTLRLNAIADALGVPVDELFDPGGPSARLLAAFRQLPADQQDHLAALAEALAAQQPH